MKTELISFCVILISFLYILYREYELHRKRKFQCNKCEKTCSISISYPPEPKLCIFSGQQTAEWKEF